jgi:hypothetical protein
LDWWIIGGFALTFAVGVWTGYEARPTIEMGISLLKLRKEELMQDESTKAQDAASKPWEQVNSEKQSDSAIENKI